MSKDSASLYDLEPMAELCARSRKLICDYGERGKDRYGNDMMVFRLGDWTLYRRLPGGRLWLRRGDPNSSIDVFSIDEKGKLKTLDVLECAFALDRFRQYDVLDDLACV